MIQDVEFEIDYPTEKNRQERLVARFKILCPLSAHNCGCDGKVAVVAAVGQGNSYNSGSSSFGLFRSFSRRTLSRDQSVADPDTANLMCPDCGTRFGATDKDVRAMV